MTMEGVQQAIKTAGERMGYCTLKDEQLQIAADVLGGRDGFVCLPSSNWVWKVTLLRHFASGIR